jgi:hypothetical protein
MRRYLVAAAVAALVLPALASGKGPAAAFVTGPGLDGPIKIRGDGEAPGSALGNLAMSSGFFAQMFGQTPDPTLASRPSGSLGPRYKVVYVVPGPSDNPSRVVQYLYPYAKPVALSYMKPGQPFWEIERAHGGWYRATPTLKRMLVRAGLSVRAPA